MPEKRPWKEPEFQTRLVGIYEDLAHEREDVRLGAAQDLLTKFSPKNRPPREQIEKILKRLVRGLCSGRKAARVGFSVALTELLALFSGPSKEDNFLNASAVIDLLKQETNTTGKGKGQESRDHHLGRLFGVKAVILSGILFQPCEQLGVFSDILDIVCELAQKKLWIREDCGWIIYEAVQAISSQNLDVAYPRVIIEKVQQYEFTKSPEGVAIWLATQSLFPGFRFPPGVWQHGDPLNAKEMTNLASVLNEVPLEKAMTAEVERSFTQKGSWDPQPNFAWSIVVEALISSQDKKGSQMPSSPKRLSFKDFWTEAVENSLFKAGSSDKRKFWGLALFERIFIHVPLDHVHELFGVNFIRCLINGLAPPKRGLQVDLQEHYLHGIALKTLEAIHARATKQPTIIPSVIKGLLFQHGLVNFDLLSQTKTVENFMAQAQTQTLPQVVSLLDNLITRPGTHNEDDAQYPRQWLADLLSSQIRSRWAEHPTSNTSNDHNFVIEALDILLKHSLAGATWGLEEPDDGPRPKITKASQGMFRSRLFSSLAHLVKFRDFEPCLIQIIQKICLLVTSLTNTDEIVRKEVRHASDIIGKMHTEPTDVVTTEIGILRAFTVLYQLAILQLYDCETGAVGVLEDLSQCYNASIDSSDDREKNLAVLLELIVSFISKPPLLFRLLTEQAFTALLSSIDFESLEVFFEILETKEDLSGQQQVFDRDDEDQDHAQWSDVEEINVSKIANFIQNDDGDIPEVSSSDDVGVYDVESPSADDDELAAFDAKLAQALGTRRGDNDLAADEDELSIDSMDDEQMEALDESLGVMFQQMNKVVNNKKTREESKKDKKEARENIIRFKCRVVKLFDILVKHQYANALALEIVLPVLQLARTTTSRLVSEKAANLIETYNLLCKKRGTPPVQDVKAGLEIMSLIHEEVGKGGKESSRTHAAACSQASLMLARRLIYQDKKNFQAVSDLYDQTKACSDSDPSRKVKGSFFEDWQTFQKSIGPRFQL